MSQTISLTWFNYIYLILKTKRRLALRPNIYLKVYKTGHGLVEKPNDI